MTSLRLAFIAPRFPSGESVGGAETLIKHHAALASELGHKVSFLTTCATDHFTWKNELEPGSRDVDGMEVRMFPVDEDRDLESFLTIQESIMRSRTLSEDEEQLWLDNGINSKPLIDHLLSPEGHYDLVIAGPYLFGVTVAALKACPGRNVLLPCLHDEPFAKLAVFRQLIQDVKGIVFNTNQEKLLAESLIDSVLPQNEVVGFSISPAQANPKAFSSANPLKSPYVIYCGRREPMKGTPLLLDYLRTFRKRTNRDISLVLTGKGHVEMQPGDEEWIYDAGFLSEEDKLSAMSGSIAFCHPSTFESLGIVLLEAWMAETPCLVHAGSRVLADQCRRSNGGLWFRCYPDFEEELTALIDNQHLRKALAKSGREFVLEEYSRAATGKRLSAIIEKLSES